MFFSLSANEQMSILLSTYLHCISLVSIQYFQDTFHTGAFFVTFLELNMLFPSDLREDLKLFLPYSTLQHRWCEKVYGLGKFWCTGCETPGLALFGGHE